MRRKFGNGFGNGFNGLFDGFNGYKEEGKLGILKLLLQWITTLT
jgi:hypothetical protein